MRRNSELGSARFARRLLIASSLAVLCLCAWRLTAIQAGAELAGAPRSRLGERERTLRGPRGDLLDRHGRPLARSVLTYDVELELQANEDMPPALARDLIAAFELGGPLRPEHRDRIRGYLRLPSEGYRHDLWRDVPEGERRGFRWLWTRPIAKGITHVATLERLHELSNDRYAYAAVAPDGTRRSERPGLFRLHLRESWRRVYPLGASAGHVVGLEPRTILVVGPDGEEREATVRYGLETIALLERRSEVMLRERVMANGKALCTGDEVAPLAAELPRAHVRTTLDADLQEEAFARLGALCAEAEADRGFVLIADLETGDILALAGWPSYDPADPKPDPRSGKVPLFPVTHQALFEPGSVIKPLLVAQALHDGLVTPATQIDCRGNVGAREYNVGGPGARPGSASYRRIVDDHAVGFVPLERVLIESSNIGAVKIGMLGGREFHQRMLASFRLGRQPALGLPRVRDAQGQPAHGAVPGEELFTDACYYERDTGPSLSFGYALNLYPLGFAEAFATAILGRRFELRLIRGYALPGEEERAYPRAGPGERLFGTAQSLWLRETLARVVTDPKGTGRHVSGPDVDGWLGGKTGTSFLRHAQGVRYFASFAGFAPIAQPRWFGFCVIEKDPAKKFYGGTYAAPVVKDLLLYLRDREGRSRTVADAR